MDAGDLGLNGGGLFLFEMAEGGVNGGALAAQRGGGVSCGLGFLVRLGGGGDDLRVFGGVLQGGDDALLGSWQGVGRDSMPRSRADTA